MALGSIGVLAHDNLAPRQISELPPGLRRQFYPPVLFLDVLEEAGSSHQHGLRLDPDASLERCLDPEQIFRGFVDRLALICQNIPSGDAVTSAAVLQEPDKVLYVFASNARTRPKHRNLRESVLLILRLLSSWTRSGGPGQGGNKATVLNLVLNLILILNHSRIKSYLSSLQENLGKCIQALQNSEKDGKSTEGDRLLIPRFENLKVLASTAWERAKANLDSDVSKNNYISAIKAVIESIDGIYSSSQIFYRIRLWLVNEERLHTSGCWYEVCHTTERLSAYRKTAETFLLVRELWPSLFDQFDVLFLDSIPRSQCPLMGNAKTAEEFVRVLTSDEVELARSQDEVVKIKRVTDFDGDLEKEWNKKTRPTVHAEIQLHHWLENNGGTAPDRFFNMYTYIGSSKPTCKLCAYYFDEHPTDVKVRNSHGNVYWAWAYPPVYKDQGEKGQELRRKVMHSIKKRIVADIFRLLTEKVGNRRVHDSTDQWQQSVRLPPRVDGDILTDYLDFLSDTMDNLSLCGEPDIETNDSTPRRGERGAGTGTPSTAWPSKPQETVDRPSRSGANIKPGSLKYLNLSGKTVVKTNDSTGRREERGPNTDTPSPAQHLTPQEASGLLPRSEADIIAGYLNFISDTMGNMSLSGEPVVETDGAAGGWEYEDSDTYTPSTSQLD